MRKIFFLLLISIVGGCMNNNGTFTDSRDDKTYKTVKMPDGKVWMAENLNYGIEGSACQENDANKCKECGRLYNWQAAIKACPDGWHLPTHEEWSALEKAIGNSAGTALKSKSSWLGENGSSNGIDKYGFNALACGNRSTGGDDTEFWTATECDGSGRACMIGLLANDADMYRDIPIKSNQFSIRCIEGNPELPIVSEDNTSSTFTDSRDDKTYKTVKMPDGKVWMAENLSYVAEGSLCYDNDPDKCKECGRLYNWQTAIKACPDGWHLPWNDEWRDLENALGIIDEDVGLMLKSKSGWNDYEGKSGNGTDDFGFTVLPCGTDYTTGSSYGTFNDYGDKAHFWSATELDSIFAFNLFFGRYGFLFEGINFKNDYLKPFPFSVRCVKNFTAKKFRNKEDIMQAINTRNPELTRIRIAYFEHWWEDVLNGKLVLKFTVGIDGGITNISTISSTTNNLDFDNEIKAHISKWRWENIDIENGGITLTMPFTFKKWKWQEER
jgi:TonB family protein